MNSNNKPKVLALAGGVGGAKLATGLQAALPAGTHSIFVGEVTTWKIQHGKLPLVYWQRDYQDLEGKSD